MKVILASGKRKRSIARAVLKEGKGKIRVNKIGKAITINQLIKENPKGKKIRLIC